MAPDLHSENRIAGVLVPLFSLRRDDDLGIGDVTALAEFIDWASSAGVGFIQLLPVNETGPDNSPYNAISAVALDPLTLDCSPGKLIDLAEDTFWEVLGRQNMNHLRRGGVKYGEVRPLKLDLLWRAYVRFLEGHYQRGTDRDLEFHLFCEEERSWLGDYCLFRMLMDMEGGSQLWTEWPEEYRSVGKAREYVNRLLDLEPDRAERQLVFYAYVQWVARDQWRAVRSHAEAKGVKLMGDIPFGVSTYSADVFANPGIFDLDWYGGAPPERLFKDDPFVQKWGQNWGIPLYRWDVMEANGFAWWRQRVRKVAEVFSLFRVDHALGFYRIYAFPWNPARNAEFAPLDEDEAATRCGGRLPGFKPCPDDTTEHCLSNRADGEKYLAMVNEAAGPAAVIAEDLGMVPEYVRPSLESLRIAGMKVPQWEWDDYHRITPGSSYHETSFATYATHDHSPMKAQWQEQRALAYGAPEGSAERNEAWRFLNGLCSFAGINAFSGPDGSFPEYTDAVREGLLRGLALSNSRYAGIMITDLLGLTDRVNVPGVLAGENWVWRLDMTVKDLTRNPHWTAIATGLRNMLHETGRCAAGK
ncbi:MAG: 4-alpha-glucanotransferase [Verrucomicrobiales bacterium]|nr:4-alpha-glucanotransferase [Akkermansiaceae bacterium]